MSSTIARMLILHPDCVCGDSFFRPRLVHRRLGPFKEVDATSTRGNPEQVKAEILSGEYGVILVCDLSTNHHWLDDNLFTLIYLNDKIYFSWKSFAHIEPYSVWGGA